MKYLAFDNQAAALSAESQISARMGYPSSGVSADSKELQPNVITLRWAVPYQLKDGRWIIPSPDNQGIEIDLNTVNGMQV